LKAECERFFRRYTKETTTAMNPTNQDATLTIRKAKPEELDAISKIEKRCFPGPTAYPKSQLAYLILKANSTALVETKNDALHGFIIVTYRNGSRVGSVETIDVDPQFQNRGVGKRLLAEAEEKMKQRGMRFSRLETSEGNQAALSLYQKAGYVIKKKLPGFYHYEHNGTCNAVQLVKAL
jgi:ribosomal protein S18 acetylase RimI-like enzyme